MAFDQTTRNRLQRFVSDGRSLLTEEFTRQLQNDYGLDPIAGEVTILENLAHLDDGRRETARILRATLAHYQASSPDATVKDLLERIVREQAFTVLNRLAALRMAEARELLIESVAAGYSSKGFQLYARLAGTGLGETGEAYRCYLFSVFDELALDLAVLFDRFSPMGRLFPRESALLDLLKLLNDPELADLWAEDETIGWIYQYFNSKEERKQMRDASAAPRNSRELAVRNQFFTPRYVVEFLVDNTLGRLWYEMTQGETTLKESCQYLVRRPTEIFLAEGEPAPEPTDTEEELSQADLLKQPVHIPFRPLKDPRDLRMLDPACGSMHFGLYAFDLYERIYGEAWELEQQSRRLKRSGELKPLAETYDSKEAFLRDVPRLIIEYNIHGVDIDPRAAQIAGLSLWLRSQKSWQAQGLKPKDRPQIKRSNIVCAEPMPGEEALLSEFIETYLSATAEQQLVGQLVRRVFAAMTLAGEAGSLLQIEREISADIQLAKQQWLNRPAGEQLKLLELETDQPRQQSLPLSVDDITDDRFWLKIEDEIYTALERYAATAEGAGRFQRRLFAEDAARGFAFIDLCRKRYSVMLMNPPFGAGSLQTKSMLTAAYPRTKNDVYAAFVERGLQLLEVAGNLGAITSRTGFFLSSFQKWREEILLKEAQPTVFADLGYGVLDAAMVETAAYCLSKVA
ncbi:SAM-dependent methyltransferase [Nodosilinea sp. LEGE 07298]|uniref:Eco57I restriction-modification methylase domain-containing protein n=1 Tax=Nodosilinea sp. LEGE 07298 TaxID=2777970 RepID=UPI0018830C4E|nr:SAM-dependent methyltransferase [Nodosilinea sp. LEGE 07298]MBE9112418.1 SAM-dependent methyltransferase [Nodosilinea sp. LEGE 07298]